MKTILHRAETRGHAYHGWLDTYHTFSFANYYDPERVHFGALRVLNDDTVAPGMGFSTHPHDNMEIITIPLEGDLEHKDSMGNSGVIKHGEIQVMSAGTGIQHSEKNHNRDQEVKLLQIWVYPDEENVTPRYDQFILNEIQKTNDLFQVLSPDRDDQGAWIHQQAWFYMGSLEKGWKKKHTLKKNDNGVYAFVIEGEMRVGDQRLSYRDGLGIWETDTIDIEALEDSRILLMEVPMII
jgi:quercetin 2,3-dioxygenase